MAYEYVVGKVEDFPIGSHKVVQIGNRQIGVFNKDGEFFALPNLCPHQVGPLCEGKVSGTLVASKETDFKLQWAQEGEIITCPWHGLEFQIESGQCLAYSSIKLKTYTVTVEDGRVKVSL